MLRGALIKQRKPVRNNPWVRPEQPSLPAKKFVKPDRQEKIRARDH